MQVAPREGQQIVAAYLIGSELNISIGVVRHGADGLWACYNGEDFSEIEYWIPIEELTGTLPLNYSSLEGLSPN